MNEVQDPGVEEFDKMLKELGLEPHKRWYRYGWKSPNLLYRRLRNQYKPIFRTRMMWQLARRGWSEESTWGLRFHLEDVIIGAVRAWREMPPHGYPSRDHYDKNGLFVKGSMTYEDWLLILDEIIAGMEAAKLQGENHEWPEGGEEKFNLAMDHLKKWWPDLWD